MSSLAHRYFAASVVNQLVSLIERWSISIRRSVGRSRFLSSLPISFASRRGSGTRDDAMAQRRPQIPPPRRRLMLQRTAPAICACDIIPRDLRIHVIIQLGIKRDGSSLGVPRSVRTRLLLGSLDLARERSRGNEKRTQKSKTEEEDKKKNVRIIVNRTVYAAVRPNDECRLGDLSIARGHPVAAAFFIPLSLFH